MVALPSMFDRISQPTSYADGPCDFELSIIAEPDRPAGQVECNYRAEWKRKIESLPSVAASCRYSTGSRRPLTGAGGWTAIHALGRTGNYFKGSSARRLPSSR